MNPQRVAKAFQFYMEAEGSTFSRAQYAEELQKRVGKTKFQQDVASMLSQAVAGVYNVQQAHQTVSNVFLAQLP